MILPENILSKMSSADRKPLGRAGITKMEALDTFVAKNEKELQKQVKGLLVRREIPHFWSRTDKRTTGIAGTPDFICCIRGRFVFIELKFGNGKLSKEQEQMIERLYRGDARGIVARSYKEVKDYLEIDNWNL